MTSKPTSPWLWWVKVRDAADTPDTLTMHGNSGWWGWWKDGRAAALDDDHMRRLGYEICCCSPVDGFAPDADCPAHGDTGPQPEPQRELQLCGAGME